jgi:tRNA:m4X modification enzyme
MPTVEGDPEPPNDWDRCNAYLKRKRRFCSQHPLPSHDKDGKKLLRFCGNHQHLLPHCKSNQRRVPCPVDPTHSILEHLVDKHVLVCPATKTRKLQEKQPFFKLNVNAGGSGDLCHQGEGTTCFATCKGPTISLDKAKELALRVLKVHQMLFQHVKCEKKLVDLLFEDIHNAIPILDLSRPELEAGLATALSDYRLKSGGARHIHQQASIVGHLRRLGALEPPAALGSKVTEEKEAASPKIHQRTVLEVGAGRGMTGLVVSGISAASGVETKFIMVERAGSRGKADTVLRNAKERTTTYPLDLNSLVQWERIQCDVSHVNMASVFLKDKGNSDGKRMQVVVVAKHLCGVGTDLALKSLEPVKDDIDVCILATCCHGACSWADYVGREYLCKSMEKDNGASFGEPDFELLRRWGGNAGSAAAMECAILRTNELDEHEGCEASLDGRETIHISHVVSALKLKCGARGLGRACQRLIDYGRREYLRNVLFTRDLDHIEMLYYVQHDITPQNAALIACRNRRI